jgi:hypothetical protein
MTFSPVHNHWQGPPSVQEADRSQQLHRRSNGRVCRQLSCTCICCRVQDRIERMRGPSEDWSCVLGLPMQGFNFATECGPSRFETIPTPSMISDRSSVVISIRTVRARRTGGCLVVRVGANVFCLRSVRSTVAGVLLWSLKRVGVNVTAC